MKPQELSNTVWAYATLGLEPRAEAWTALGAAVVRVGPGMNPQNAANTLWSVATLDEIGLLLTSTRCPVETHLTATTSV